MAKGLRLVEVEADRCSWCGQPNTAHDPKCYVPGYLAMMARVAADLHRLARLEEDDPK